MRRLCLALLLLPLLVCIATPGRSDELIRNVALFEDQSGEMTLSAVVGQDFATTPVPVTAGYGTSAIWLRIDLDKSTAEVDVILRVFPPVLDEVTLYRPDPDRTGHWISESLYDDPDFMALGFHLHWPEQTDRVYLRIRSVGARTVDLSAMPLGAALATSLRFDIFRLTYLAFMATLLVWSIRMARLTGEGLFWRFALLQGVWVPHNILTFGYAYVLLPWIAPETMHLVMRALVLITTFATITLHKAIIGRLAPPRPVMRLFDVILAFNLGAAALFPFGQIGAALALNSLSILFIPFVLLVTVFSGRMDASPGRNTLRLAYLVLSSTLFLWMGTLVGLPNLGPLSLYSVIHHGTATGLLMFIVLHRHAKGIVTALRNTETALVTSNTRHSAVQEQSQFLLKFIDMLGHETRNAMAVIRMTLGGKSLPDHQRRRVEESIDGLNSIIDRSIEVVRLESGEQRVQRVECDLHHCLTDLISARGDTARLRHDIPEGTILTTDPLLLRVIISNLIDNAVKYAAEDSIIDIRFSREKEMVTLEVENVVGFVGMPDPDLVFRKYYRSELAHARLGSGLGLYLVDNLVRMLGGSVHCLTGNDTVRFVVLLPC